LVALFVAAMALPVPGATAQESKPHAEACTTPTWGYLWATKDAYGAYNLCSYAVDVWFMSKAGQSAHAITAPGGYFNTGLTAAQFVRTQGWITATCPAGYTPSVSVSDTNWDVILKSQYSCVK
jgi:hypothetical protein